MAEKTDINYPDVLAFITQEAAHTVGPIQMALATRPRIVKAGKPFEVIMLMQNTIDAPVDVALTLQLPDKDVSGQKNQFLVNTERLVVGLEGAEVGYAMLPISTLPNTAPSDQYAIGMDVSVKALEKGERVRQGDATFNPKSLPSEKREKLKSLTSLKFSTKKRGFLRGNAVETPVTILSGKVGAPLNLEAGWHSLWTLEDNSDADMLLVKYREMMLHRVVPELTRKKLYKPMLAKVQETFAAAGYELMEVEAICITKLMILILEYAQSTRNAQAIIEAGIYDIDSYLNGTTFDTGEEKKLPRWFEKMLRALARDERVAKVPVKGLLHFAFYELLFDAMMHSFDLVQRYGGEDLGNEAEMAEYSENAVTMIKKEGPLDFSTVYMPLMIGGVLAYDRIMMPKEVLADGLNELKYLLGDRADERNDTNEMIFAIAKRIIDQSLKKYGSLDNRL